MWIRKHRGRHSGSAETLDRAKNLKEIKESLKMPRIKIQAGEV